MDGNNCVRKDYEKSILHQVRLKVSDDGKMGKDEVKEEISKSGFLADYMDLLPSLICLDIESLEDLKILSDCSKSTQMPVTSIPSETPSTISLEPLEKCKIQWEKFVPAEIRDSEGLGRKEYAGSVGFLEGKPANAKAHMKTFLADSLELGGDKAKTWISNNRWINELETGENRYVNLKLENFENMMLLVYRCSSFAIGILPSKLDSNHIMQATINDWNKDFDHLDKCTNGYKNLSNSSTINSNIHFKFRDQMDINKPKRQKVNMDVGIRMRKNGTGSNEISMQEIEAAKYLFGYSNPLRDETFEESYDNYHRDLKIYVIKNLNCDKKGMDDTKAFVRLMLGMNGIHLLPIDLGFGPFKKYAVAIVFQTVPYEVLEVKYHVNEANKEEWLDKMVTLEVEQEVFACDGIYFFMPRLLTTMAIDDTGRYFTNQGATYTLFAEAEEKIWSYRFVDKKFYKLYEGRVS